MSNSKKTLGTLKFSDQPMNKRILSATGILAKLNSRDECLLTAADSRFNNEQSIDLSEVNLTNGDPVIHPEHYQGNGYEVLDIIQDIELNFNLGNVLKYILRAGRKDLKLKEEDLEKALFYLKRELEVE